MKHSKEIKSSAQEFQHELHDMLGALGTVLPVEAEREVIAHMLWVIEVSEQINLTAIREPLQALRLHVLDSLMAIPELDAAPAGPFCDIGTGGGYPGVPLALATGRDVLLVDSVGKKVRALDGYLRGRGLGDRMTTWAGRAEALALVQPAAFAAVCMRAVAPLVSLMELAAPLLVPSGRLVALKADVSAGEMAAAREAQEITGMHIEAVRPFLLPRDGEARSIVSFVKVNEPQITLPRREGLAQKKPLFPTP